MIQKIKNKIKSLAAYTICKTGLDELLTTHKQNSPLVLMYHRITDPKKEPYPIQDGMYVRPETFEMQMKFLSEKMNFISIEQVREHYEEKKEIPKNSVCITFDDGWYDNYENAFPILKKYKVPACIFLPTSFIETDKWFWSDLISYYVNSLNKSSNISQVILDLAEIKTLPTKTYEEIQKALHAGSSESIREHLDSVISQLKPLTLKKREEIIQTLSKNCKKDDRQRQFMNWQEAKEMEAANITFASHSHSHLMFENLSKEEIENEIEISRAKLCMHLKSPSNTFCYPEGSCNELSHNTISELGLKSTFLNKKTNDLKNNYNAIGRVGIHEDISSTAELFNCRIKLQNIF